MSDTSSLQCLMAYILNLKGILEIFFFITGYLEEIIQDWVWDGEGYTLPTAKFDK